MLTGMLALGAIVGTAASGQTSFPVSIFIPPNQPPTINAIPNLSFSEGATIPTITPMASDPDGDTLTYTAPNGLPPGLNINPTTGQITGTTFNSAGTYNVDITATDPGGLDDTSTFTWIVTCLLYTSPSPRDATLSRMPSSA